MKRVSCQSPYMDSEVNFIETPDDSSYPPETMIRVGVSGPNTGASIDIPLSLFMRAYQEFFAGRLETEDLIHEAVNNSTQVMSLTWPKGDRDLWLRIAEEGAQQYDKVLRLDGFL